MGAYSGKNTQGTIFDPRKAYRYGRWIGERYRQRPHLVWMLGGDRPAVVEERDYRPIFRAMAEGIADGVNGEDLDDGKADFGTTLMSYHPPKTHPSSSLWLHHEPWLDFHSIQAWPDDAIRAVADDRRLTPTKPTWLFEGRYEGYWKGGYAAADWGEWQSRFQAYQTVFSGGFGHTYGNEAVFGFEPGWRAELDDPGAEDMRHLARLVESIGTREFLDGAPDQTLVLDPGAAERSTSDRQTAIRARDGRWAAVYIANGRNVGMRMARLGGSRWTRTGSIRAAVRGPEMGATRPRLIRPRPASSAAPEPPIGRSIHPASRRTEAIGFCCSDPAEPEPLLRADSRTNLSAR